MQTVDASLILADAQRAMGVDLTQLEQRQKDAGYSALSLVMQEVWDAWWWQELMTAVQMSGASVYDAGTTYAAAAFTYFPATQKFYQALRATTGNAPATLASGDYSTNLAYWGEASAIPAGADYITGTNDAGLALGSIVRNPVDGLFYQLYAYQNQMVVAGAGFANTNVTYDFTNIASGHPVYYNSTTNCAILWFPGDDDRPAGWVILELGSNYLYYSADDTATPDLATGWFAVDPLTFNPSPTNNPVPTVVHGGNYPAPPDAGYWGLLTAFVPTVSLGGTVRGVGVIDPRNSNNAGLYPFEEIPGGIRIPGWAMGVPWIWYRLATPHIDATDFDATATYTALASGDITFN